MKVDACLSRGIPVGGQRIVSWVLPVVEDVVNDLRNHLRPRVRPLGHVCIEDRILRQRDTGVGAEYVGESEDVRNDSVEADEGDGSAREERDGEGSAKTTNPHNQGGAGQIM